ncbi:MAG: hypothetical protein E4H14_19800 [Candidatus Thorarchaeota archaeon]|nr:MAG: hypothetical protein E4H14_19800 [Candidatus Thorarchaeota archaeon]
MLDRRQIEKRVKILQETRHVLHSLSKQRAPRGLEPREQLELERYNKWLSKAGDELAKVCKMGEQLLKQKQETEKFQEMNMAFSLQYLQLQQDMQQENRQFTLVSNIMKVKHDTAKAAINNVR